MKYDLRAHGAMKPCPFCGSEPILTAERSDERSGYAVSVTVHCTGCGVEQFAISRTDSAGWNNEPDEAVQGRAEAKWNQRTP